MTRRVVGTFIYMPSQFSTMEQELRKRQLRVASALEKKPGLMVPRLVKALRAEPIRAEVGMYEGVKIFQR